MKLSPLSVSLLCMPLLITVPACGSSANPPANAPGAAALVVASSPAPAPTVPAQAGHEAAPLAQVNVVPPPAVHEPPPAVSPPSAAELAACHQGQISDAVYPMSGNVVFVDAPGVPVTAEIRIPIESADGIAVDTGEFGHDDPFVHVAIDGVMQRFGPLVPGWGEDLDAPPDVTTKRIGTRYLAVTLARAETSRDSECGPDGCFSFETGGGGVSHLAALIDLERGRLLWTVEDWTQDTCDGWGAVAADGDGFKLRRCPKKASLAFTLASITPCTRAVVTALVDAEEARRAPLDSARDWLDRVLGKQALDPDEAKEAVYFFQIQDAGARCPDAAQTKAASLRTVKACLGGVKAKLSDAKVSKKLRQITPAELTRALRDLQPSDREPAGAVAKLAVTHAAVIRYGTDSDSMTVWLGLDDANEVAGVWMFAVADPDDDE